MSTSSEVNRRTVIAAAGAAAVFAACSSSRSATGPAPDPDAVGKVVILGAGAAGMTAAHLLRQRGVVAEVLEAAPTHGGRIRHNVGFADFPIPLGAEWIHVDPSILDEIVNDERITVDIETVRYAADARTAFRSGGTTELNPLKGWEGDSKIVGSSWLDFFDRFIVPDIADQITYDTQITLIDHTDDEIELTDTSGLTRRADHVIVTVPLKVLQRSDISFTPPLGGDRAEAIAEAVVWSGLKAFIEFDHAFYPAAVEFEDSYTPTGQRVYYDAAYGQRSGQAILGLFSVGDTAERYQAALRRGELLELMLAELDAVFDGAASPAYVRHIVQNWNDEPFAGAAYLEDEAPASISRRLAGSIDGRIHFAGDAYTSFDDWSSVHTAVRSAAEAVDSLLS